jgi:hypothetical protein
MGWKLDQVWQALIAIGSVSGLLALFWNIYIYAHESPLILVTDSYVDEGHYISFTVANAGKRTTTITKAEIATYVAGESEPTLHRLGDFFLVPTNDAVPTVTLEPGVAKSIEIKLGQPEVPLFEKEPPYQIILTDSFGTRVPSTIHLRFYSHSEGTGVIEEVPKAKIPSTRK